MQGPVLTGVPVDYRDNQWLGAFALTRLLVGTGLTVVADAGWAHALGVTTLYAFAASAFVLAATVDA